MQVVARYEQCVGHTMCNATAPRVFDLTDEGTVVVLVTGELPPELEAEAAAGVAACPERVLSLARGDQATERLGEQHV